MGALHKIIKVCIKLFCCPPSPHFMCLPGNLIEWKYPPEVNLEGVEFKSIASGLHNVAKDFM